MSLREIFCQDKAIGILQRASAARRSAHAYIFAGLEGVGKYATARQWAKLLLCENPTIQGSGSESFADSCGSCSSCALIEGGAHPDFGHIYKELREFTQDGKGKPPPLDMPIDVIREFLLEKAPIRPSQGQRKVFVVSEAEKLNAFSQNALLKLLEEPPDYCTIILLCTRIERLLPTTKSRCQIIRFGPIDEPRIVKWLIETGFDQEPAQFLARLAQGSLGQACQWARLESEGASLLETKRAVVTSLATFGLPDALDLADRLLSQAKEIASCWTDLDKTVSKSDLGRRAQKTLVRIILSAFHDAMRVNTVPEPALIHLDQPREIARLAARIDPEEAAGKISEAYEALRWIDANVNERLIFERLLLRLAPSAIIARKR